MADRDENEFLDDLDALEAEFDEQEEAEQEDSCLHADDAEDRNPVRSTLNLAEEVWQDAPGF